MPVSKKPTEVRMGKGKGSPEYWVAKVKPGRIIFEIDGVPDDVESNAGVILFVDQITHGISVVKLLKQLQSQGVDGRRIRLITALCASPGLKLLGEEVPDLTLHTACIDEGLTAAGTIQPGIGDPLRRLPFRMSSHD